ncbi:ATP-binding cassette domain-containing protein [bacterium]|nr:ATP-binding cassette domain-containing protein [candidate division CSSED10-310 bacterium]
MIKVKGLTKRFGNTLAVRDISFQVPAGQVLGFLGPNGAGKTTTMRILTGYMPADEGTATIAGFDIYNQSLEVRKRIGYLPESAPLYLDMDVPDFLTFIARIRKIPLHNIRAKQDRIVEMCGLKTVLHKKIGELSKGYRQRVGLAQAMIHDPDILVLDEPTSGLDPNQIVEIRELIRQLGREKTVILSTHILPEVTATCDRILIIHEGRLVADGTPEQLATQAAGDATLWITVAQAPPDARDALIRIHGVKEITVSRSGDDDRSSQRFGLRLVNGINPASDVFRCAVDNGWTLTELRTESATLEDIFAKLTT